MTFYVFMQLIKRDLLAFKREFRPKFLDTCILFFTNIMVFCYFMPKEGIREDYGVFFLVGAIASFGFIEIVGKVGTFVGDMQGDRSISHTLIMPIHSKWIFWNIAVSWAITSSLLSILLFPLGKLFLWHEFDLTKISYIRLIPMFITSNLFFGCFALWLASVIKDLSGLNGLWLRYIAPLWMFGAYFYSWHTAFALNPVIGYLSFIDPMVYVMEGMRAAALGPKGYLPFFVSFLALWAFIIVCALHACHRLKKRLDCV